MKKVTITYGQLLKLAHCATGNVRDFTSNPYVFISDFLESENIENAIQQVKVKPFDLYKDLTIAQLKEQIEVLEYADNAFFINSIFEKEINQIYILIANAKRELVDKVFIMLDQVDFD